MPFRLLHLIDAAAGHSAALGLRAALSLGGSEHHVVAIGPAGELDRVGLTSGLAKGLHRVSPSLGHAELGVRQVARRLAGVPSPDAIIAWSPAALRLSSAIGLARWPRLGLFTHWPVEHGGPDAPRSPRPIFATRRAIDILCPPVVAWPDPPAGASTIITCATETACLAQRQLADPLLSSDVRELAPPPPSPASAPDFAERRNRLRERFRVEPGESVTLLLSDWAGAADARHFAFTVGLQHTVGARVAGLAPSNALGRRRTSRFIQAHGRRFRMAFWDGPLIEALPLADIAVAMPHRSLIGHDAKRMPADLGDDSEDASAAGTLTEWDRWGWPSAGAGLIAAAARSGIPTIVPDGPVARDLHRARVPILIAHSPEPRAIAGVLLPITQAITRGEPIPPFSRPALSATGVDPIAELRRYHAALEGLLRECRGEAQVSSAFLAPLPASMLQEAST